MQIVFRIAACLIVPAGLCGAPASWAQQAVGQTVQPIPASIQDRQAPSSVATSPAARPQQERKIPAQGPAPLQSPRIGIDPADGKPVKKPASVGLPLPVYSPQGVPMPGMLQMEPGRVLDPATGRYYPTTPTADGQRVIKND